MLIVQVLLLLAILAVLLILVRRGHTVRTRAFKRVAFLGFLVATVYAILRPGDVTWLANRIGVGRGTDLLLYCLAMAFFAWAVNTYVRFRNLEARFAEVVRAVALQNAQPPMQTAAAMPAAPPDLAGIDGSAAELAPTERAAGDVGVVQDVRGHFNGAQRRS